MASTATGRNHHLFSARMLALAWLPILAISTAHFATSPELHWLHDVLRRLYYLPILLAAFQTGLAGGMAAVALVVVTYYPHAFLTAHHVDPAAGVEKALEIVLYVVVGGVAGWLTDQERRRRVELQRALDEQRVLQQQLVRAGRLSALGEVVAGIAHEIKNPLHALAGTAEVVDPLIPAEAEERGLWELHKAELKRLERTAERFLSFARPTPAVQVELDLCDVARRLVELVGAQARKQGVEITLELPDAPVSVMGDRDQLAQVGLNLAVNALEALGACSALGQKAMETPVANSTPTVQPFENTTDRLPALFPGGGPPDPQTEPDSAMRFGLLGARGGSIRVAVATTRRADGAHAELVLENDGPPVAEADLERLFDPFHSGREGGTGLGLSISARIVELHDGTIEVENGGLGVRFRVGLPGA
jgi:signal transduction histidine kinase